MYERRLCALHARIVVLMDLIVRLGLIFTVLGCKGRLLALVLCLVCNGGWQTILYLLFNNDIIVIAYGSCEFLECSDLGEFCSSQTSWGNKYAIERASAANPEAVTLSTKLLSWNNHTLRRTIFKPLADQYPVELSALVKYLIAPCIQRQEFVIYLLAAVSVRVAHMPYQTVSSLVPHHGPNFTLRSS